MKSRVPLSLIFLFTLFVATLVTGLIGWSEFYAGSDVHDTWDVIYHTLLAFTGDASFLESKDTNKLNTWIDVSRFTGLIATISAVLGLAAVILQGEFSRLRAMRRGGHVVMIGASNFALDRYRNSGKITVFDTRESLDQITVRNTAGRLLKIADPMTKQTGTNRLIGRPATVVFGDADPVMNVERARVWRSATKRGRDAQIALRIEDASISRDLELLSPDFRQATLFSRSEIIARALVTSIAPNELALSRGQERVHLVLVGLGRINLAVAEEMAMRCQHNNLEPMRITILDLNSDGAKARIRRERPALFNPDLEGHLEIKFISLNALECCAEGSAAELIAEERETPFTAVVVAAGEDARNVAIAMRLRQLQKEKICLRAPIFMRSDSLASIAAAPFSDLSGEIVPFGGRALDDEDVELDEIYMRLAKDIHERWRNAPDVEKTAENAWENLSNKDRRASFRAALSAIEMFYGAGFVPEMGCRIAGLRLEAKEGNKAIGDASLIRSLSQIEHERWNVERLLEGWRKTNAYRDNEKKVHRLILPFEDLVNLGEKQEDKDEYNIKATLTEGIERFHANHNKSHWRRRWRIGLIGPLSVDSAKTHTAVSKALGRLVEGRPHLLDCSLEILTPNAPGFDREAATAAASDWRKRTGRPARLLLMNAASPVMMDKLAMPHVAGDTATKIAQQNCLNGFAKERETLQALETKGHLIRTCDCRPLGHSNADLEAAPDAYRLAINTVQDIIMKTADDMIFNIAPNARFTQRAAKVWADMEKSDAILV